MIKTTKTQTIREVVDFAVDNAFWDGQDPHDIARRYAGNMGAIRVEAKATALLSASWPCVMRLKMSMWNYIGTEVIASWIFARRVEPISKEYSELLAHLAQSGIEVERLFMQQEGTK